MAQLELRLLRSACALSPIGGHAPFLRNAEDLRVKTQIKAGMASRLCNISGT